MESVKSYPVNATLYERSTPIAKCIGVNLVNNPRNVVSDSVSKSQSGTNPNKNLAFSSVSKFTYKVEKHKRLLKNIPVDNKYPTENPYPFGMLQSSISDTNYDTQAILKDCESYVKREQIKVKARLTKLVAYLNKAFTDMNGDSILAQQLIIDAMSPGAGKDAAQEELNTQITEKETVHYDATYPLIIAKYEAIALKKESLKEYFQQISDIYTEQADSNAYGEARDKLQIKWDLREKTARDLIKNINNEILKLQQENEQLIFSIEGLLTLKNNYTNEGSEINADESPRTFIGIIPKLEDDLYLHTQWMSQKLEIQLVSIDTIKEVLFPFIAKHDQSMYGFQGFWGCEMLTYEPNVDIIEGGTDQHLQFPDRQQLGYWDQKLSINDSSETLTYNFTDYLSIPNTPEVFVVFNIIKNKYPLNYTRMNGTKFYNTQADRDKNYSCDLIMTKDDSLYLQNLITEESLNKEFHPTIQLKNINGFENYGYTEELLRNLYLDLETTNTYLKKVCDTKYSLDVSDTIMQGKIKNTGQILNGSSFTAQRFRTSSAYQATLNYYLTNTSKTIKEGKTVKLPLSNNISDIYLQQGISLNTRESASIQYLIEFFSYLKSISKVDKTIFINYENTQSQNPDTNLRPFLLQNKFTIKNKVIQYDFEYSYIEEEELNDTWVAEDYEYKNGIKHNHKPGFAMLKIIPKPRKEIKYHAYTQFNYRTLLPSKDYFNRESTGWAYLMIQQSKTFYEKSILELYYQKTNSTYIKVSVHGLKQTITRRPGYLLLPKPWVLSDFGVYNEEAFTYDIRQRIGDVTENTLTSSSVTDNQIANSFKIDGLDEVLITPTISNNLSAFIIPLWDHDMEDIIYNTKGKPYSFNTMESVYQDSLNLLIFAELTDKQTNALGEDKYWVGVGQRDKVLTAYLDTFISKYSLDQSEVKYSYLYKPDNGYPKDEVYNALMFNIGTAPNVSAYLVVPPNPFNGNFMTAMQRVSITLSSQQMNNKSTFHFESLSLKDTIFGDVQDNKFKFK